MNSQGRRYAWIGSLAFLLSVFCSIGTAQTRPVQASVPQVDSSAGNVTLLTPVADANSQPKPIQETPIVESAGTPPVLDPSAPAAVLKQGATLRLQQLAADTERPAAEKEALTKIYQQILVDSSAADQAQTARATWTQRATQAATALEEARSKKSKLNDVPQQDTLLFMSFEEGRARVQQLEAELATATTERTNLSEQITKREKRRKELPQLISDAKAKLEQLAKLPVVETAADPLQQEAAGWATDAAQLALNEQVSALESEQRAYEAEAALLPLQLELAQASEKRLQEQLGVVNAELARIQQDRILSKRSAIYDLVKTLPPELKTVGEKTLERIESWLQLAGKQTSVKQEIEDSKTVLDHWKSLRAKMDSRVNPKSGATDASGFNSWVGLMLRKQRTELPDANKLASRIRYFQSEMQYADSLLFDLEDAIFQLKLRQELIAKESKSQTSSAIPAQVDDAQSERMRGLLDISEEVLDGMKLDVDAYLFDLYQVADIKHQTKVLAEDYRILIDQHILWIRSSDQLQIADGASAIEAFRWAVEYRNWKKLLEIFRSDLVHRPWWYGCFALITTLLLANQASLRRGIGQLGVTAEKKNCTSFLPTARAMLFTLLISIPVPLIFLFGYWRISEAIDDGGLNEEFIDFAKAISRAAFTAAMVFAPLALLRQLCRIDGLGIKHFNWEKDIAGTLARHLRWLIDLSTPLVFLLAIFSNSGDPRWEASLGRIAFICTMPLLSMFFFQVLKPDTGVLGQYLEQNRGGWLDRLRYVWYPASILGPLALVLVSFTGYHYTAMRIATHINQSLWSAVLLIVYYYCAKRWIVLNRRKLMIVQARQRLEDVAKREASREATGIAPALNDQPEFSLAAINEQTKRLLTSLTVAAGFLSIYFIWNDILPAVSFLDNFELWSVPGALPDESVRITLANLVLAIPVVVLLFVAARNVPGLLEIAFLQHLPLTGAARYAITTLTRYAIVGLGVIFAASTLGLKWTSIQWLVAALGLGLGFGLQEIFANFVSGIILLFEQPLRVGDVVTVDGTTGTVQRIRMRATTIVNWDRQELIVPNKDLITGKLLNWTLTDSTNRIVLNVGIAYGSDTLRACEIICQICQEHPNILREPVANATFEGFGDNTLNITLRAFLQTLDNRLETIHQLHQAIYTAFGKAGIEIAFPQRDIHIRSLPAQLQNWLKGPGVQLRTNPSLTQDSEMEPKSKS
jgi:potassium-dependent mechanosensitive channel